jgi:MFS superfamily sulfate permease-like transporter
VRTLTSVRRVLVRVRPLLQGARARSDPRSPSPVSWLVFDAEAVTHADSTGLGTLDQLAKGLRADGITLAVARLRTRMEEQFASDGVTETIGSARFYPTIGAAVAACVNAQEAAG